MKISLTRLLNEIKLANSKIDKKLREDVKYFDVVSSGKFKAYKSESEMKQVVESQMQSIKDLIKQRDEYKRKLLTANNATTLEVAGETYTIAEAIAKKDVISQELSWIERIERQFNETKIRAEQIEANNEEKLDELIKASIGKDKKTDGSEMDSIAKVFRDNNKVSVADPAGTEAYFVKRKDEIEDFINNIDFSLSEVNAKTEISI